MLSIIPSLIVAVAVVGVVVGGVVVVTTAVPVVAVAAAAAAAVVVVAVVAVVAVVDVVVVTAASIRSVVIDIGVARVVGYCVDIFWNCLRFGLCRVLSGSIVRYILLVFFEILSHPFVLLYPFFMDTFFVFLGACLPDVQNVFEYFGI